MNSRRVIIDCRELPSESNCSIAISGTEDEVVELAAYHAVKSHGHEDTAKLRDELRRGLKEERGVSSRGGA